ncbi:MAG: hypothetical protein QW331_03435 [Candidatus Woesearchaeota archaeon]
MGLYKKGEFGENIIKNNLRETFSTIKKMKWKFLFPIAIDVVFFFVFSVAFYYFSIMILESFEQLVTIKKQLEANVSENTLAAAVMLAGTLQQHLNELLWTMAKLIIAGIALWAIFQPFSWALLARTKEKIKWIWYFTHFNFLTAMAAAISFTVFWFIATGAAETGQLSQGTKIFAWIFSTIVSYLTFVGYALLPQESFKDLLLRIPFVAIQFDTILAFLAIAVFTIVAYYIITILYAFQPRVALILGFSWGFFLFSWARLFMIVTVKN